MKDDEDEGEVAFTLTTSKTGKGAAYVVKTDLYLQRPGVLDEVPPVVFTMFFEKRAMSVTLKQHPSLTCTSS